jgi:hypothetical protein
MKKKLLALLMAATAIFTLTACRKNDNNESHSPETSETSVDSSSILQEDSAPELPTTYTISWLDENGNVLSSADVEENTLPQYTYTPVDTAEWDYTFQGWAASANGEVLAELPVATGNTSYYAIVSKVKQSYTVHFDSNGGSEIPSQTITYGELATIPEAPTYEGHKFMGWATEKNGENLADFNAPITQNTTYYAIWNEVLDLKSMFNALLNGYKFNPLQNIPESMQTNYNGNLVNKADIINDYSSAVNVSDITYGHGEQWHMVMDNLQQTALFLDVLTVVDSLTTTSITAFNNYFDSNPADTAHHEFKSGIYNVTVNFDGEMMTYVLDYTATLPLLGEQTIQIALTMDAETGTKSARIQLGDANALTYTLTENSYQFALTYLGVRKAMFSMEKADDNSVSGNIYEFLTVSDVEVASAAEFYITEDYVSVVGNKADGLTGFTNYINELYDVENGQMLGYEVREEQSTLNLVFNTLWFNLNDVAGITKIKQLATDKNAAKVFINGSSKAWEAQKVGGLFNLKSESRRFDIEFRTQYVYSYDTASQSYEAHAVSVPMMFVQEEYLESFAEDVENTNGVAVSITVNGADINKIMEDYKTLIPAFAENKEAITPDMIIAYIGDKKIFN